MKISNLKISDNFKKKIGRGVESLLLIGSLFGTTLNLTGCDNVNQSEKANVPTDSETIEETVKEETKIFNPGEHIILEEIYHNEAPACLNENNLTQLKYHEGYTITGIAINRNHTRYITYTNTVPVKVTSNINYKFTDDQIKENLVFTNFGTPIELENENQKTK